MVLTSKHREKLVLDLYNEGKTIKEIAKEAKMSFRDIGYILKEAGKQEEQTQMQSISSQAYRLFSEGKTVLQVAIALNLRDHEVRDDYFDIFGETDTIQLDPDSLVYVIGELQIFAITEADRDVIGDAFEVFIGKGLRGEEGQFFTPRNVVRMMVEILNPSSQEFILDPACGSGGFLIVALGYVWQRIDEEGKRKNWSTVNTERKKIEVASKYFYGIDKDSFLSKVTKAYMALVGDGKGGIFCVNSLKKPLVWENMISGKIKLNSFDVVITNPPFGSKITVRGEDILSQYDLARVWKKDGISGKWKKTDKLRDKQAPQILFIERCIQLLKPKGSILDFTSIITYASKTNLWI